MSEVEILKSFLAKAFAMDDNKIEETLYDKADDGSLKLKDTALDEIIALDTAKVARFKKSGDTTEIFNNGHKKGLKEGAEKVENELKQTFSVDESLTGKDLFAAVINKTKTVDITEDKIKLHPVFLENEKRLLKEKEESISALRDEFDQFKNTVESEKRFSAVRGDLESTFLGFNPILSEDAVKAKRQTDNFLDRFKGYEIKKDEGVIIQDGKRLEDEHGNPISIDTFVRNQAELLFDFKKQSDKGNAGNNGDGRSFNYSVKSDEEYNEAIKNAKTPQEQFAIQDAYYKAKGIKSNIG